MNDQRIGAAFRAVRVRRGWRQSDVATRAGVSAGVVSLIERGHLPHVSTLAFRAVASELEIRADIVLSLPHGELDRLLNAGHAELHEGIARYLNDLPGWLHAPEVSFAFYSERGVIDILAFHPPSGSLLIIELKTELVSLENLLTTMDVRVRHAAAIAQARGWVTRSVSAWIVFADTATNRRRVAAHRSTLRSAFPADGRAMRSWLREPDRPLRALSFWSNSNVTTPSRLARGCRRVRVRKTAASPALTAA
ncbi:MAG TPA: helix-turn-helix transcriptional regulator [Candidatus Limnocylindrales bacterium]|nr:helix-turn-helix transcriptional regulator [Candidatus Limnocylindrales bacterium]